MANQGPVLIGLAGVVEGEVFPLEYGKSVIIGRSRACDISLRNCKRWLELEETGEVPEESSKTVSRRHLKITFHNADSIELEDLSSNGTYVDGSRIDRMVITDIREAPHEVQMGGGDKFRLEWR
ncbi:MAG: FHA domain-containing protein [Planctomycetota bacterium]